MEVFIEIAIILGIATGISILMRFLRQPLIVGYIVTGIIAGPYVLNILHSEGVIELFSKIGITVLLFIVGLSLNPKVIHEVGKVSLVTGLGQVIFTSVVGFVIALALGIDKIAAFYVSIALTFSSTIIILKLLSDKGDLDKLYGKIAIGFLLVQDIVATIILLVTTAVANSKGDTALLMVSFTILKGILLVTVLIAISQWVLPRVTHFIAKSQELLFITSIAWGMGMAALFSVLGFSVEIGALVAGVTLSTSYYAFEIGSRLRPLRDFFIVLFFILLGSQMILDNLSMIIVPTIILSLFVLVGNPIIVVVLMNLLGYNKRTGFMAGLTVAQISEFSLILAALGFQVGHISREILSLVTFVGLVTIAGSTYLILYSDFIYEKFSKVLSLLELKKAKRQKGVDGESYDALLFGFHRVGEDFVKAFKKLDLSFMVIDFNPLSIQKINELGYSHRFGDAQDVEFLQELNIPKATFIVSTMPDFNTNLFLLRKIREINKKAIVLLISHHAEESKELYDNGASYVIMPHYLGAQYASRMIGEYGLNVDRFEGAKDRHLTYLEKRKT